MIRIEKEGLVWPCPTPDHPGTPVLHIDRFTRGKGVFFPIEYHASAELTDAEYPFILTTGRVHAHYHTGTMTRKGTALTRIYPEALAEINEQDAKAMNLDRRKLRQYCFKTRQLENKSFDIEYYR